MTSENPESAIARYGDLRPGRAASMDGHSPGSEQKECFRIIGQGPTSAVNQVAHITGRPGFQIVADGQPPKCLNALHSHRTAEVFFVLSGRWRFFWGRFGTAGEVILEEGDLFNVPTGMFRGFENVGGDFGMLYSILGGNDAGGGVIWAPQAIEAARENGVLLGQNGQVYDTAKGESLPDGVAPMPGLTEAELKVFPEPAAGEVIPHFVARYWDMMAAAGKAPVKVIGPDGLLKDRPGFAVDLLARGSIAADPYIHQQPEALVVVNGHWRVVVDGAAAVLAPGDTMLIAAGLSRSIEPSMTGQAALYRVRGTDDPAGPTMLRPVG